MTAPCAGVEVLEQTTKKMRRTQRLYRCANGWSVGVQTEIPALLIADDSRPWSAWLIDETGMPVNGTHRDFLTEADVAVLVEGVAAYVPPVEPPRTCAR